jgi:hypothetical protein
MSCLEMGWTLKNDSLCIFKKKKKKMLARLWTTVTFQVMNLVFSMLAEEITTATKIKWFEVRHLDTIEHQ